MTLADHGSALDGVLAALRSVPGVSSAEVEMDPDGGRLRLDLGPGADGAGVAAQVDRLLRERFGVGLDTDHVQVIEDDHPVPDADPAAESASTTATATATSAAASASAPLSTAASTSATPLPPQPRNGRGRRPSIQRVQTEQEGLTLAVTVTLRHGDRDFVGHSTGASTRQGTLRSVATATAEAIQRVADGAVLLDVEHVEVLPLAGGERTVVVSLGLASSAGTLHLTGAASVRSDARQAVVRATLDAVNRRLEAMDGADRAAAGG